MSKAIIPFSDFIRKDRFGWLGAGVIIALSGLFIYISILVFAEHIQNLEPPDSEITEKDLAYNEKIRLCLNHKVEISKLTIADHKQAIETFNQIGCPERLLYTDCQTEKCQKEIRQELMLNEIIARSKSIK